LLHLIRGDRVHGGISSKTISRTGTGFPATILVVQHTVKSCFISSAVTVYAKVFPWKPWREPGLAFFRPSGVFDHLRACFILSAVAVYMAATKGATHMGVIIRGGQASQQGSSTFPWLGRLGGRTADSERTIICPHISNELRNRIQYLPSPLSPRCIFVTLK